MPSPSVNTVELIVIHNTPCEHSSKLQLSIRFTPSRCLDVRQDWYPMYYPEGMKARVSPVQSIEPHRILAPTRDLNREPPGSESRVVTTILPLHTVHAAGKELWLRLMLFIFPDQCLFESLDNWTDRIHISSHLPNRQKYHPNCKWWMWD